MVDLYGCLNIAHCILIILVSIVGSLLNLLCGIVFLLPSFRSLSINVLLFALSISDIFLLISSIPTLGLGPLSYYVRGIIPIYAASVVYVYPMTAMFHCTSIWLLVAVTGERWVAVCRPLRVNSYCTRKRAARLTAAIALTSVAFNFVRFWEFSLATNEVILDLRSNNHYMFWYSTLAHLTLLYVAPLTAIVLLTIQIASGLRRSLEQRSTMTRAVRGRANQRVAKMLLYVIITFIICYGLSLTLSIVELTKPQLFQTPMGHILSDVNNLLVLSNAASPFFFYFKHSHRFSIAVRLLYKYWTTRGVKMGDLNLSQSSVNPSHHAERSVSLAMSRHGSNVSSSLASFRESRGLETRLSSSPKCSVGVSEAFLRPGSSNRKQSSCSSHPRLLPTTNEILTEEWLEYIDDG